MIKAKLFIFTAFLAGLMFCAPVFAQTDTTTPEPVLTATDTVSGPIVASATTVSGTVKIYGTWGLIWQDLKDRIILTFTIDSVKKVEKLTAMAEKRIDLAEAYTEKAKDNPVFQERAQKMMEKAMEYMQKVGERKADLLKKADEHAQKLLQKAADQALRREAVLDRMEEKLSPERMQKLEEIRLKGLENSQRLLNAIGNENISSSTKAHLEEVKIKIEVHLQEVKQFVEQKKEILQKAKTGDATAIEELKTIHKERIQIREERREEAKETIQERIEVRNEIKQEVKETRQELIEKAEAGDTAAREQLKNINQVRKDVPVKPVICTQEAMICPNGSSVGRAGPNCEFAACPEAAQ